ncbi:hypothetical protein ACOME3_006219 [Neoechinorhynchus agilis]
MIEAKDHTTWTESRTFWTLMFQKLVCIFYRLNWNMPESRELPEDSQHLLNSLLFLAAKFPVLAFRYSREEEIDRKYERISSLLQDHLINAFSGQLCSHIRFEQSFKGLLRETNLDYALDRIADCCVWALEQCIDSNSFTVDQCVEKFETSIRNISIIVPGSDAHLMFNEFIQQIKRCEGTTSLATYLLDQLNTIKANTNRVDHSFQLTISSRSLLVSSGNLLLNGAIPMPGYNSNPLLQQSTHMCSLVRVSKVLPMTKIVLLEQGRVCRQIVMRGSDGKVYSFLIMFGSPMELNHFSDAIAYMDDILVNMPRTKRQDIRLFSPNASSFRLSHDLQLIEDYTCWRDSPSCPLAPNRPRGSISLLNLASSASHTDYRIIAMGNERSADFMDNQYSSLLRDLLFQSLSPSSFFYARQQLTTQVAVTSILQYLFGFEPPNASDFEILEVSRSGCDVFPCQWRVPIRVRNRQQTRVPYRLTPMIRTLISLPHDSTSSDQARLVDAIPASSSLFMSIVVVAKSLAYDRNQLDRFIFSSLFSLYSDIETDMKIAFEKSAEETKCIMKRLLDCQKTSSVSYRFTESPLFRLMEAAVSSKNLGAMKASWFAEL